MAEDEDEPEIVDDEPCDRCGYNLRGLREGHRCPECGTVILPSFPPDLDCDPLDPFRPIAKQVDRPLEGVLFVWNVAGFASERAARAGRRPGHVSAEEFGWSLRDFALQEFGSAAAARERLVEWRLTRSEDVGAVLFALVEADMLTTSGNDRKSDFDGLFTSDRLFEP